MNLPRLIAAVAILGMIVLIVWVIMHLADETSLGSPRTKDTSLPAFVAAIPRIGDFKSEFNINEVNPFVPFEVSQRAAVEITGTPRPPKITPQPQPPVIVEAPPKPKYTTLTPKDIGAPECLGVIRKGGTAVLVARRPGMEKTNLEVGEAINGWTLREIGIGVAIFADPTGEAHELPIGTADGTVNPDQAQAPTPATPTVPPAPVPVSKTPLRPGQPSPSPAQQAPPMGGLTTGAPSPNMRPTPAPDMVPRPRPK